MITRIQEEKLMNMNDHNFKVETTIDLNWDRPFDANCFNWSRDQEANYMYLKHTENYFNAKLQRRGYVFLNEIYDSLSMRMTKTGQIAGWTKNTGKIEFEIFKRASDSNEWFIHFLNVCENILEYIEEES